MANDSSTVRARRVLGVGEHASPDEVRRSYVKLARTYHPDRFAGASAAERAAANNRMQEINDAWRQVREQPAAARRVRGTAAPKAPPFPEPVEYGKGLPPLIKFGPWVFLLILLAAIFVVTAFADSGLSDTSLDATAAGDATEDSPGSESSGSESSSSAAATSAGTAAADGSSSETSAANEIPVAGRRIASAQIEAVLGQCVEVVDGVVIAFAACTPQASGTLEAAKDATGACLNGSVPVHHRDLDIGMCLRPWGS